MIKKLLIVFAAGALLASCSSPEEEAAATAFCECYSLNDSEDVLSPSEIRESAQQAADCFTKFQAEYDGKISQDGFSATLKDQCPEAYPKAEEMGMFK